MPSRTGAQHLIDALSANGVERIFGVPGESYLAALDALVDAGIPFIQCRQNAQIALQSALGVVGNNYFSHR